MRPHSRSSSAFTTADRVGARACRRFDRPVARGARPAQSERRRCGCGHRSGNGIPAARAVLGCSSNAGKKEPRLVAGLGTGADVVGREGGRVEHRTTYVPGRWVAELKSKCRADLDSVSFRDAARHRRRSSPGHTNVLRQIFHHRLSLAVNGRSHDRGNASRARAQVAEA